jgi:SAM-dependent methyltransferase
VDPREIDSALESGEISEDEWYVRMESLISDAYLSTDDPRAQSGKSGDEVDWRWSRELVLDACPPSARVLDVGCANGYLMESLDRWGRSRGMMIEPYGLDISERLVALARRRLPHWADRIAIGNVMTWIPARRFDVVHTGLDYVPAARRRDLVERILGLFLVPGGRLVLRAERSRDPGDELCAMGRQCHPLEAVHPVTGVMRRSVWVTR